MSTENQEEKCCREQFFYEMNLESKVEFLAKELQRTQRELSIVSTLLDKLLSHAHCDGRIVSDINRQSALDTDYYRFRQYQYWRK